MSDVELDWEELSTKFDEANQTIGALPFENSVEKELLFVYKTPLNVLTPNYKITNSSFMTNNTSAENEHKL